MKAIRSRNRKGNTYFLLLLLFSHPVLSDTLQFQGLQHTRPFCPSPSPEVCPNSCPLYFAIETENLKFSLNSGMGFSIFHDYIFSQFILIYFSLRLSVSIHYNSFLEFFTNTVTAAITCL